MRRRLLHELSGCMLIDLPVVGYLHMAAAARPPCVCAACSSEQLQQWELSSSRERLVESLMDRLKVRAVHAAHNTPLCPQLGRQPPSRILTCADALCGPKPGEDSGAARAAATAADEERAGGRRGG